MAPPPTTELTVETTEGHSCIGPSISSPSPRQCRDHHLHLPSRHGRRIGRWLIDSLFRHAAFLIPRLPLSSPLAQGPGPFPAGLPSPCCHTPDGLDHPCRGTLHCPFVSHFRTSRLSSRREACQGPSCSRDGGEGDRHHVRVRTSPRPCLVLSSVSVLWWSAVLAKGCTRRLRFHLDLRASPPLPNQGPRARHFSLRLTWSQAG